jgi:hypothetical protein
MFAPSTLLLALLASRVTALPLHGLEQKRDVLPRGTSELLPRASQSDVSIYSKLNE